MSRTVLLLYHRVNPARQEDPHKLAVTPEDFTSHLNSLCAVAHPISLDNLVRPAKRSSRPRFVVTFDDGYADNIKFAAPIAADQGIPIAVFVTSGAVSDRQGFWWDRLVAICRRLPLLRANQSLVVRLTIDTRPFTARLEGDTAPSTLMRAVHTRLRSCSAMVANSVLDELAAILEVDASADPLDRTLTASELSALAQFDHVIIGAHTRDHSRLSGMGPQQQYDTMRSSKDRLQQQTGKAVVHFAYPFGGLEDFDRDSVTSARRCGFATACTTVPGHVLAFTPRLRLPRYTVSPRTTGAELIDQIGISR